MLRQAIRPSKPARPVAEPLKWIAPVKGWRTDIPVAEMPPDTASALINWFPEAAFARARNGSQIWNWMSGGTSTDATLIPYEGATPKLFVAATANNNGAGGSAPGVYDVTAQTPSVPVLQSPSTTTAHMSSTQISTAGGHFLCLCPTSVGPQTYNGTTWSGSTFTGLPVDPTTLSVTTTYRERLYFLQKGTTLLWYGGTSAIAGALTSFDVGADLKHGGLPVALATWTKEIYTGILQFLVIISSTGETLVFQGSNPSDPTNWSLLGTFKLSPPLGGDRCAISVGGDVAIMTMDGIVPISQAITLDPAASDLVSMTKAIAPTFLDTVQRVGSTSPNWGIMTYPARRMAVVNVPDLGLGTYQYVMNTETQAWCQFTGWNALHFRTWQNNLYFIDIYNNVVQAEIGSIDQVNTATVAGSFSSMSNSINAVYHGPWQRGDGISRKSSKLMTVDTQISSGTSIYGGVSADYNPVLPQSTGSGGAVSVARWDIARWDIDVWPGQTPRRFIFNANSPVGVALAPSINAIVNGQLLQPSALYMYGGTILLEQGSYI